MTLARHANLFLLRTTSAIFGAFLGFELLRMFASLFLRISWNVSGHLLRFMLLDGLLMFLALLVAAYITPAPRTANPYPSAKEHRGP